MKSNQDVEYEPLNPRPTFGIDRELDSDSDLSWSENETSFPSPPGNSPLTSRIFWAILITTFFTAINTAFYPLTLSSSVRYIANWDVNLDEIDSLPDFESARAKETMKNYHFIKPDRIAGVNLHKEEVTFDGDKVVFIGEHETTIMQFTVPSSKSNAPCSMVFFRPPMTATSELTGHLHSIQVWEIHSSARPLDSNTLSFKKNEERMIGNLDLTKQAAMAVSQEFACTDGGEKMFEFRCAEGKPCGIKYEVGQKRNMGFQLRRHI